MEFYNRAEYLVSYKTIYLDFIYQFSITFLILYLQPEFSCEIQWFKITKLTGMNFRVTALVLLWGRKGRLQRSSSPWENSTSRIKGSASLPVQYGGTGITLGVQLCSLHLHKEPGPSEMTEFHPQLQRQMSNLPDTQGGRNLVQHVSRTEQKQKAISTSIFFSIKSGPKSKIKIGKNLWTEAGPPQN